MPKKRVKKGGGGRQGGLTEEERLLYTKQRAQAEEELAKRKEEMLTQFLKDKLHKEEKNSAVNLNKLTQQWRTVLRQTRAAELRQDMEVSMQTFERVLDHKNSIIKCLVNDLHEAEQQSAQALRSHLCFVESLQALQTDRLASHEEQWNDGQQELSSEFNSEREKLLSLHQQEFVYLEDVTFAMEQRYSEVVGEARQDYQSTRDEIKNRHIKEKHDLRNQLEGSVKTLWCQYQQAQQSYKEATEDRRIAYESLRARDQCSAQEIESQTHTLQKMQDSIATLRASLSSNQRESEAAARELRAAREKVTLQTRQLKAQMSRAHASEKSRLTDLVIHSNTAAKKLQDIVAKGEKLLRRAEMCSKLESDREKVLPFYMSSLTLEEEDQVRAQQAMDPPGEELAKAMTDYWDLERFWQRYNKVLLERLSLEKEELVLTQENQQLQALLRQYLDGISVSDNVLRQRNPLLMVSQHTLAVLPEIADRQRAKRHVTVIEAAHVVQYTL